MLNLIFVLIFVSATLFPIIYILSKNFQCNIMIIYALFPIITLMMRQSHETLHIYRDTFMNLDKYLHYITFLRIRFVDFGPIFVSYILWNITQINFLIIFLGTLLYVQLIYYMFGVNTNFLKDLGIKFNY